MSLPIVERLRAIEAVSQRYTEQSVHGEAADTITGFVEALRWYADQFCEFGTSNEGCGKFSADICSGCKARAAISLTRGQA